MNDNHTICYLSELGHNNFWYPSNTEATLSLDCDREEMAWICGDPRKLTPIKVRKSCVFPKELDEKTTQDIDPPATNDYTIVWINS